MSMADMLHNKVTTIANAVTTLESMVGDQDTFSREEMAKQHARVCTELTLLAQLALTLAVMDMPNDEPLDGLMAHIKEQLVTSRREIQTMLDGRVH